MWYSTVWCIVMLILSLLAAPPAADAQPRGKVPRIGFLGDGSAASRAAQTLESFREGPARAWIHGRAECHPRGPVDGRSQRAAPRTG